MDRAMGVEVPISMNISSIGQLGSNEHIRKRGFLHEIDSTLKNFQRRRKTWMVPRIDSSTNREVMSTLLTTQGEDCSEYIEKLLALEISYQDLASLTHKDLELMGFRNYNQRQKLLDLFAMLPNQDIPYDSINQLSEASDYNREIFNFTSAQIESMRSAVSAANYKLMIMPPEDVVVGDKSFASRFVLEALNELRGITNEITKELKELETFIAESQEIESHRRNLSKNPIDHRSPVTGNYIMFATALVGSLGALWFWKLKNSSR